MLVALLLPSHAVFQVVFGNKSKIVPKCPILQSVKFNITPFILSCITSKPIFCRLSSVALRKCRPYAARSSSAACNYQYFAVYPQLQRADDNILLFIQFDVTENRSLLLFKEDYGMQWPINGSFRNFTLQQSGRFAVGRPGPYAIEEILRAKENDTTPKLINCARWSRGQRGDGSIEF
jgi:hypothetical protein